MPGWGFVFFGKKRFRRVAGGFPSLPFFTSLNVMHRSRWLLDSLSEAYVSADKRRKKRIMWFTDTFLEMSGVCATLQELATLAQKT